MYDKNGVSEDHKFSEQNQCQLSKFRTKNWLEVVNDYTNNGEYESNSQINFNTTMLKSSQVTVIVIVPFICKGNYSNHCN